MSASFQPPLHAFRHLPGQLDAILFEADDQGRKRPTAPFRALISVLVKLADWSPAKSAPGGPEADIHRYVQGSTTHAQRHAMTGIRIGTNPVIAAGAYGKRLSQGAFSRALAESESLAGFLRAVGGWVPDGQKFGIAEYRALKEWLLQATRKGGATRILDRQAFVVGDGACSPEDLLQSALGFGVALVLRMPDTLLPCFRAIAPGVPADQKPQNLVCKPLPSSDPFARPFLLDDIEAWLRALKADPAPVLSDGWSVPLAHQRRVARGFMPLPDFLPSQGFERDARSGAALWMIFRLDFAVVREPATTAQRGPGTRKARKGSPADKPGAVAESIRSPRLLAVSGAGEAWLSLPRRDRLAALLAWAPLGARASAKVVDRLAFLGGPEANRLPQAAATDSVFAWLDAAFASLRAPADWRAFLASAAAKANPFVAEAEKDAELAGRWAAWETPPEEAYADLAGNYAGRLASLGALAFAPGPKGTLSVTLASVGAWMYRKAAAWELPVPARFGAVVGADFTISLLAPDPESRSELSAFTEPAGAGFRLTRNSVQAASQRGHTAASILKSLSDISKHALPANVAHEIGAWAGGRKTVRMGEAIVLEGDDPVVLAEIRAAFPREFTEVSPLAIKYVGKGTRAALSKRLAKKGFFPAT